MTRWDALCGCAAAFTVAGAAIGAGAAWIHDFVPAAGALVGGGVACIAAASGLAIIAVPDTGGKLDEQISPPPGKPQPDRWAGRNLE